MTGLVSIFESLGYRDVLTVAQSGNVIFAPGGDDANVLVGAIAERYGFRPHVMFLSPNALHLYFLESRPTAPDPVGLEDLKRPSERFELDDSLLYLYTPEGFGRSKLASAVERHLGVAATARNWNTVKKLESVLGPA